MPGKRRAERRLKQENRMVGFQAINWNSPPTGSSRPFSYQERGDCRFEIQDQTVMRSTEITPFIFSICFITRFRWVRFETANSKVLTAF